MSFDAKTVERLHNSQDFLAFLEEVQASREAEIRALYDADKDKVMGIAGKVCALDHVLGMGKYNEVVDKWRALKS